MNNKKSPTLAMNERVESIEQEGKTVYRFGFGQSPFPVPNILVEALKKNADKKAYLPVQGLLELREAIAGHYSQLNDQSIDADQVLIGPGSKELIWSLIYVFDGDIVLHSPSWVSYHPQAVMARKKVHWIHTERENNWIIDPAELAKICQSSPAQKLLILNYPNNPSGTAPTDEEMLAIADVCRQYNVILIHDQIYGKLQWSGEFKSISQFYPEGSILSDGLSKWAGAGGWRLGIHIFPKQLSTLRDQVIGMASETYSCVSSPIQYAAIEAFGPNPEMSLYTKTCMRIMQEIAAYVISILSAKIDIQGSQGGFYLCPDFNMYREHLKARGIQTSMELCERLLVDTGVALLPGTAFGAKAENLVARLAFVDFDGTLVLSAVTSNPGLLDSEHFVPDHCPKVARGLEKLINWLD